MARRKSNEKKELIARIKEQNKIVQRLYKAGEESGEINGFLKTQRQKFGVITHTKNKNKIAQGYLKKMSIKSLKLLEHQQSMFIKSKWLSEDGREEIYQKQYETMTDDDKYTLTRNEFDTMRQLFGDDDIQELRDIKQFSSDQIISIAENRKESFDKIIEAVREVRAMDDFPTFNNVDIKKKIYETLNEKAKKESGE